MKNTEKITNKTNKKYKKKSRSKINNDDISKNWYLKIEWIQLTKKNEN